VLVSAQELEQVTFEEAVRRAITSHPTVQQAASALLRAQSVERQVRSRAWPTVDATVSTNVIAPVTEFSGESIVPRTQTLSTAGLTVPLYAPVRWAERVQAGDQVTVSARAEADARRAIALAAGQAYLSVIAARRVVELNERARDNARSHFEYANQRYQGGLGSRLNALRAEQELSSSEARVEAARLAVRRTQEALGVLTASDRPVDAGADPVFQLPPASLADSDLVQSRQDVQLIVARQSAAQRVADDAWKDRLPSVTALVTPQMLAPAGLFAERNSWRATFLFSVPIFDAGERRARAQERNVLVDIARLEREDAERRAASEIRAARAAILASERARDYARVAARQAGDVLTITDVAFREGATTNIEVIDAQRRARDAETAAEIAEDSVRQSYLELLVAAGRFP
jgi:multidrug efflux system outer membrane protein